MWWAWSSAQQWRWAYSSLSAQRRAQSSGLAIDQWDVEVVFLHRHTGSRFCCGTALLPAYPESSWHWGRSLRLLGCQKRPGVLGVPAGNEDGEGAVPLGQVGECLDCRLQSWPGKGWPWAALAIKCCHCHAETEVTCCPLWWLFLLHRPPLWHCDTRNKQKKNFTILITLCNNDIEVGGGGEQTNLSCKHVTKTGNKLVSCYFFFFKEQ